MAKTAGIKKSAKEPFSFVLFLIGLFKMLKAVLLIVVGIAALKFVHKDLGATVLHWAEVLRVDPDNRYLHRLLVRIFRVTPKQLRELSAERFCMRRFLRPKAWACCCGNIGRNIS